MKYQAAVAIVCVVLGGSGFCGARSAFAATVDWVRQHGSSVFETSSGVAVDGLGGVYVIGDTRGNMDGANAGERDGVLMKYDNAGDLLWTRQFGLAGDDGAYGVAADALGNVFITGSLQSSLHGQANWFVSLYDGAGDLKWTREGGNEYSNIAFGSSVDGLGNVVFSGATGRRYTDSGFVGAGYVSKYDNEGNMLWTNSLSTGKEDIANATSVDAAGNVYVVGSTTGDLGGVNAGGPMGFWLRTVHWGSCGGCVSSARESLTEVSTSMRMRWETSTSLE